VRTTPACWIAAHLTKLEASHTEHNRGEAGAKVGHVVPVVPPGGMNLGRDVKRRQHVVPREARDDPLHAGPPG
jgi:hypothetical protein